MAAEKRNYGVYKITNNMPNAKRRTYYIVSSITDTSHLIATVRGMSTSSTAAGGIKSLSKDMAKVGKDYKDKFSVTKMRSGMSKHDATVYRNSLRAGSKKAYHKLR